jgi:hypothetical protein
MTDKTLLHPGDPFPHDVVGLISYLREHAPASQSTVIP